MLRVLGAEGANDDIKQGSLWANSTYTWQSTKSLRHFKRNVRSMFILAR